LYDLDFGREKKPTLSSLACQK